MQGLNDIGHRDSGDDVVTRCKSRRLHARARLWCSMALFQWQFDAEILSEIILGGRDKIDVESECKIVTL